MPPKRSFYPKTNARKSTRGLSWSDEETECLLSVWNEKNVEEQLEDPKRNKGAIYTIAAEMEMEGFHKSSAQCKIRMHTLMRTFWGCKKNMKTSGILGQRQATSPVKLVESMARNKRFWNEDMTDESNNSEEVEVNFEDNKRDDNETEEPPKEKEKKLDTEMKKMELEKQKLEVEERLKREERDHQFRMMQMIIGRVKHPLLSPRISTPKCQTCLELPGISQIFGSQSHKFSKDFTSRFILH
ncbi:uncharacterized protein LOC125381067 [Haliotis rufescens]|uniref:uncharacterized protein LOC125381067 n=1 Tax=Haliotis rufescens TaxID=6454 RepID=UPI00201E890E|nr:uncharacterized protein LOC125381067 [Haliotis rufescens]